jgi:hypothetical protein
MKRAVVFAILLCAVISARGEVVITSPDHAETFAYGEMIWHQLSVDPNTHALSVHITFSNLPYVGSHEPRVDESFDFRFPQTHADIVNRNAFIRDRHGNRIVVASFRGDLANGWGNLAPGTKIYLLKESGRVTAVLTATNEPRPGMRWIQMDNNCSLQNLLTSFCNR